MSILFQLPPCNLYKKWENKIYYFQKNSMKTRHVIYIILWAIYFYLVYFYFWVNQVSAALSSYGISPKILNYISAFFAFFLAFWLWVIVENVLRKFLGFLASKTEADIDDAIIAIGAESFRPLVYLVAIYASLYFVTSSDSKGSLTIFLSVWIIIAVVVFAMNLTKYVFKEKILKNPDISQQNKTMLPIIYRTIIAFIVVFWVIAILGNMGYDVSALLAGAGIWGIALALAAQSSAKNIFWVITILLNKPFEIGDNITLSGHNGVVSDIHLTYITLITTQWDSVMIPNADIIDNVIQNDNRRVYRRSDFTLWLDYDTDAQTMKKAIQVLSKTLDTYVDAWVCQSYRANFWDFWAYSQDIVVTYFSNTLDYSKFLKELSDVNLDIKKAFSNGGFMMAFPTQEIVMKNSIIPEKK